MFTIAVLTYVLALGTYLFHAVDINPQTDTQGIRYSLELLRAKDQGQLWEWLIQIPARKYPMLYIVPFSLIESFFWVSGEGMPLLHAHFITRAITLLYGIGTLLILPLVTKQLFGDMRSALLVLMTSTNFFMFMTAVRPHIVVAFWTLLTLYLSLMMIKKPSRYLTFFAFGSAACSFAVLQSGLLAFIFPILAMLSRGLSWKSLTKASALAALFGVMSIVIGYPFVLNVFLGSSGSDALTTGFNHDEGLHVLPQLIPIKMWEVFACDTILVLAAGFGLWRIWNEKKEVILVIVYIVAFCLLFGTQPITAPRFFIPMLPFLAILSVPMMLGKKWLRIGLCVLCILMYSKLAYLGQGRNTYQQVSEFVMAHDGVLFTKVPSYFLNLPHEKYGTEQHSDKQNFFLLRDDEHIPAVEALSLCASFVATNISTIAANTRYMFFWNEVRWPLVYLPFTKSLGMNLRLYCLPPL